VIDDLGEFVLGYVERPAIPFLLERNSRRATIGSSSPLSCSPRFAAPLRQKQIDCALSDLPEVLRFVNSRDAAALARPVPVARTTSSARRYAPC